ncbi:hypothetical protein DRQ09_04430 [candidate division KSB1 bacterium]|nr:MAG: hypothetical protein DRQ09_04430 [candidate division KSB1 bacterium]
MKILESFPEKYNRGITILTRGNLDDTYNRLITFVKRGQKVLDIGCGTGMLTIKAAKKGAFVKGIDVNPGMLETAKNMVEKENIIQNVEFSEMGAVELESETSESYDIVMSGLCFSELNEDELSLTLKEIKRILKPGGLLLIADETIPKNILKKIVYKIIRFPFLIITYILTQSTTKPVKSLDKVLEEKGFLIKSVRLNKMENFVEIVAKKP